MKQPEFLIVTKGGCVTDVVDLDGKSRTYAIADMDTDDEITEYKMTNDVPMNVIKAHEHYAPGPFYDYRRLCGKLADAFGTERFDYYNDVDIMVVNIDPINVPLNDEDFIFAICDDGAMLYKFGDHATGIIHYDDLNPYTFNRLNELLKSIRYE